MFFNSYILTIVYAPTATPLEHFYQLQHYCSFILLQKSPEIYKLLFHSAKQACSFVELKVRRL